MSRAKKLAINGGVPVRRRPFPPYPILGTPERQAVLRVLDRGVLSGFPSHFLGGTEVQSFEKEFADHFGVAHAIAVNSGTAALHVALAAAGVGPGDEVVVPCYTFTATASAVLHHNAIPVFADVDPRTFCVTAASIEAALTPRTKAIIPVHLLGHPCDMGGIMALAKRKNLIVIEDNAQSPGATWRGRHAGTIGDAGTFSFVETKNLVTGEGGMVVTNRDELAERCRLVRNHGEVYVAGKPRSYVANILGWNYRMTELEAAIGRAQLTRFDRWTDQRIINAEFLSGHLRFPGISIPYRDKRARHVYHLYGVLFDESVVGIPRRVFQRALVAEGVPWSLGYPHPLYKNPLFQEGTVYGVDGCPFTCRPGVRAPDYRALRLHVAESLCGHRALWTHAIRPPANRKDMKDVVNAFEKVYECRHELVDGVKI